MRKIDVIFRHNDVIEESLKGKHAIVIDVLRATTVLITALSNGAASVRTVSNIAQAFEIQKTHPDVILAGEREAVIIDGFHFGNSPLNMISENISGKHLVMCTSNGTKAVAAARQAEKIWAAALINLQAIANQLLLENLDITIICSGTLGNFSLDDVWAAGLLINRLLAQENFLLSDSAQMAAIATQNNQEHKIALKDCYHLNLLLSKGFQKDVDYCLSLDVINVVPKWNGDRFVV
jgi:2-phosphosulfolactate phosphatase